MDYFKQRRAYRDFKVYEGNISETQNNLYRELLDYANDKRRLDQSFRLTNDVLLKLTGSSMNGLVQARKKLVELNLIEYSKGQRNLNAPSYKIVKLYDDFITQKQVYNPDPEISITQGNKIQSNQGNNINSSGTSIRGNILPTTIQPSNESDDSPDSKISITQGNRTGGNKGTEPQTLRVTNLCTSTITNTDYYHNNARSAKENDDDDFKNLITYYQKNIGQTNSIVIQSIQESVNDFVEHKTSLKECYDIVKYAIELTAKNNVHNWNYVNKILMNWQKDSLFTLANIKASQNERSNKNNQSRDDSDSVYPELF